MYSCMLNQQIKRHVLSTFLRDIYYIIISSLGKSCHMPFPQLMLPFALTVGLPGNLSSHTLKFYAGHPDAALVGE